MPNLRNNAKQMEIGWVQLGGKRQLYVQVGNTREYYGTLLSGKADKFLRMLKEWDEAGGNDGDTSN